MGTLSENYSYFLPADDGDVDVWGSAYGPGGDPFDDPGVGYNGNWQKADERFADLESRLDTLEIDGVGGNLIEQFYTVANITYDAQGYRVLNGLQQSWGTMQVASSASNDPTPLVYTLEFASTPLMFVTAYAVTHARYPMVEYDDFTSAGVDVYNLLDHGDQVVGTVQWFAIGDEA